MANATAIKAQIREKFGSKAAHRYRKDGLMPGIIYGHKQKNVPVALSSVDLLHQIRHGAHLLELQLPDSSETVLVKEIQYNYLGTDPIHVDFSRVALDERVPVNVPVILRGIPVGVKDGGVLRQVQMEVEIECLVTDIPDQLKVSIADLELNQSLQASDIPLPEGVKLLGDPQSTIVTVSPPVEEEESEEEVVPGQTPETGAEPEIISKGKEKEEEEQKETKD